MIFQHFAAISTCPPSYWAGHCLCAANQGNAAQNWLSQHGHEPKRSDRGRVVVGSPTAQQHWAHSTGEESCMAVKIFASKDPNWLESPFQNEQDHLREQPGRSRLGSRQTVQGLRVLKAHPALAWVTSGSAFPRDKVTVLMLHHQAGGMKVAAGTEWLWMAQGSLWALWCSAHFPLSMSSSLSYLRHWFPALNKEDVKSTEFDQLPGIWLGYKDFDILQKLRIKISCCCSQVCVTVFI